MKTKTRNFLIACLFLAGSVGLVKAQSFTDPVFTPAADVVEFGELDSKTDKGFRILTFTNTGNSPLLISDIKKSCGCTAPEWPKEPIQPGKSGQIKVVYDITRIGLISKTITVVTNEPDGKDADGNIIYKQHVIPVKGNVK